MIKFKVRSAEGGFEAGEWCSENLSPEQWDLWMDSPGFPIYTFEFKRKEDATIFALRWGQYT
jgi:hypothetical protein